MLTLIANELIRNNVGFSIESLDFCDCILIADTDFIITIDHNFEIDPVVEKEVDGKMVEICFGEEAVLKFIEGLA